MDHRRSSRKVLRQEVGIDSTRIGSLSATTHDVSLGGMFVETGPLALPPNASVTVSFHLPQKNGQVLELKLDAAVVRFAPGGVGLMFLQMEPDVIRALSRALAAYH